MTRRGSVRASRDGTRWFWAALRRVVPQDAGDFAVDVVRSAMAATQSSKPQAGIMHALDIAYAALGGEAAMKPEGMTDADRKRLQAAFTTLRPHMRNGVAVATWSNKDGMPWRAIIAVDGLLRVDDLQKALALAQDPPPTGSPPEARR